MYDTFKTGLTIPKDGEISVDINCPCGRRRQFNNRDHTFPRLFACECGRAYHLKEDGQVELPHLPD